MLPLPQRASSTIGSFSKEQLMTTNRTYDLYGEAFRAHTHAIYARMRAEAPIFQQPGLDGTTPIWYITRAAEVEQVLLDSRTFVRDPALVSEAFAAQFQQGDERVRAITDNHMLNYDGDDHRRLRALVSKAFTPRVIEAMRPRVEAIAAALLDEVAARGHMELIGEYAFPLPITVIAELLGVPLDRQDDFRIWSDAFVRPAITPEQQQASMGLLVAFAGYMQQLVAERRQTPRDDLISRLIQAEEQGDRLSESELFSMIALLIVAGHETTVSLIGNATLALLEHPQALAELRDNPARIPTALEELLRYDSPVERALVRFLTRDIELAGQQLRRGDLLIAVLGSANRDAARFAEPAQLDFHRGSSPHLAFGKGAHYCLGAPLARIEGEIALRALLGRFPDLRLAVDPAELSWRDVPLFRSLVRLPVAWGKRVTR
jgi:cytochrome P450